MWSSSMWLTIISSISSGVLASSLRSARIASSRGRSASS